MNNVCNVISQMFKKNHFDLTKKMIKQFEIYVNLLIEWNKKINLTAILDPEEIVIKHFLDSLLAINAYEIPENASVIDVGTGAGFPGVPLKIIRPDINLTLLDSLNKRLIFLKNLSSYLNIDTNLIHARAEDASKDIKYRENFDIVVSRAVAPLNVLLEYCVPFAKLSGVFLALKGSKSELELEAAKNAQKCLNVKIVESRRFSLIDENDRNIIVFKKLSKTPSAYPRNSSRILKNPL